MAHYYRRGHVHGALEGHGEAFRAQLLAQGYTEGSAGHQVLLMAHLSRWLDRHKLAAEQLDRRAVTAFLSARRSEGYVRLLSPRAMTPIIEYLLGAGVMADEVAEPKDPTEVLLGEFEEYLVTHRGLAVASVRSYAGVARRFLSCATNGKGPDLLGLSAATVSSFVCLECGRRGAGSASTTVTGARAWLRFPYATGRTPVALAGGGPVGGELVAEWPSSFDRRQGAGKFARQLRPTSCSWAPRLRDLDPLRPTGPSGRRSGEPGPGRHRLAPR